MASHNSNHNSSSNSKNRIANHAGPVATPAGQMAIESTLIFHYSKGVHQWIFRFRPSLIQQAVRSVAELVVGDGVQDEVYLSWYDAAIITKAMRELVSRCG